MEAYLDNSATTPVSQWVKEIVIKTMMEDYGNPSSMHMKRVLLHCFHPWFSFFLPF